MLNLLIKDIMLLKKTILIGFIYIAVMALAFNGTTGPAMFTASTFAVAFLLIQTPCAHDDKSRAEPMLLSLPVRRDTVVSAKYAAVALYTLIAAAQYLLVYGAVKLTGLPFHMAGVTVESAAGLLLVAVLFASIFYPLFFRLGYMKMRYVNIFLFAGLFAGGGALAAALRGEEWAAQFARALESQPEWLLVCGLVGVMLGMLLISYCLSLRFYRRREF